MDSQGCDFGVDSTDDNTVGFDIWFEGTQYGVGNDATFTCTGASCSGDVTQIPDKK